jgi:phosphoglycolate phosphatase
LQPPTTIIFDLDGTLVDSAQDIQCALNAVLNRNGLPGIELDKVKLMIGGGPALLIRRALQELGVVMDSDKVECLIDGFRCTYLDQGSGMTTLFRGARSCLEYLTENNILLGLCSNKPEDICLQLLTKLRIRHFFAAVQGSGSGLPMKPHPAALLAILRHLGTAAEHALYVGDSQTDVDVARAAGVAVALVNSGYTAEPASALGADWVVDGLTDIPSIWR